MSKKILQAGGLIIIIALVCMLGASLVMNSIVPLAAIPGTFTIYVKDSVTNKPIPNALVTAYIIFNVQVGSGITNADGWCKVSAFYEQKIWLTAVASGYTNAEIEVTWFGTGNETATIFMIPSGNGPTYVTMTVYCITSEILPVKGVKISSSVGTVLSNDQGVATVICVAGTTSLAFNDDNAMYKNGSLWDRLYFSDFTVSVTASNNAVWTAYVTQGSIQSGPPPSGGGFDWDDIAAWLFGSTLPGVPNWALLAVAIFMVTRR